MVARVQAAHAEYPAFKDLPVGGKRSQKDSKVITCPIDETDRDPSAAYVKALYELSFRGAMPIGRIDAKDDEPAQIIGEVVAESAERDYNTRGIVIGADGER